MTAVSQYLFSKTPTQTLGPTQPSTHEEQELLLPEWRFGGCMRLNICLYSVRSLRMHGIMS